MLKTVDKQTWQLTTVLESSKLQSFGAGIKKNEKPQQNAKRRGCCNKGGSLKLCKPSFCAQTMCDRHNGHAAKTAAPAKTTGLSHKGSVFASACLSLLACSIVLSGTPSQVIDGLLNHLFRAAIQSTCSFVLSFGTNVRSPYFTVNTCEHPCV